MTARSLESSIARLLTAGTYVSVALITIGVVSLAAAGTSPLDVAPAFDLTRLVPDLIALQPAGFLWLGILGVIATPAARVAAALVGYARSGERPMLVVSALILLVIALGVLSGTSAS
jgi:uncharacterized membrane protein